MSGDEGTSILPRREEPSLSELESIAFPRPFTGEELETYLTYLAQEIPCRVELAVSNQITIGYGIVDKVVKGQPVPRKEVLVDVRGNLYAQSVVNGALELKFEGERDEDHKVTYRGMCFHTGLYDEVGDVPQHHMSLLKQVRAHTQTYFAELQKREAAQFQLL